MVDYIRADYVTGVDTTQLDEEIVEIINIGQGEEAVQVALELSTLLSKIQKNRATIQDHTDYSASIDSMTKKSFSAKKGSYKSGMIVGLEKWLLNSGRYNKEKVGGIEVIMGALFEGRNPKSITFNQLITDYLQRYHSRQNIFKNA